MYPKNILNFLFPKKFNNQRLVYYHIMKTGGTSINHFFYSLLYNKDFENIENKFPKNNDYRSKHFIESSIGNKVYSISNRNDGNVSGNGFTIIKNPLLRKFKLYSYIHSHNLNLKYIDNKKDFCFSVIREPGSRIVSLFKYFFKLKNDNLLSYYSLNEFNNSAIFESPKKFLEIIKKRNNLYYGQIFTFSRKLIVKDAFDNFKKLNFYINFDNLNKDFKIMLKKFNLDHNQIIQARTYENLGLDINILHDLNNQFIKDNYHEIEFYKKIKNEFK